MHETYSSVLRQSLNDSFCYPSFFKDTSKLNEFFLPPDTPSKFEKILQHHKRDPVLKIF